MDGTPPAEAWEDCYERLAPKLLLYARQWTPERQTAEDAVQEAFLRVWKQRGRRPLRDAYFFAATRTSAIDHWRRSSRREAREFAAGEGSLFEDVEMPLPFSPHDIEAALATLPAEQRETVALRIWGGLEFAEIAEVTRTSNNTAASRYRYALAALKKYLDSAVSP